MIEIRKIALEVLALPPEQVVRTAGVLRKFKNWLKGKFNKDFQQQVQLFKDDNQNLRDVLDSLEKAVDMTASALEDGAIPEYQAGLATVKDLTLKFWQGVKKSNQHSATYNVVEMQEPEFISKVQKTLPAELTLGPQKTPLTQIKHYSNLSIDDIFISDVVSTNFLRLVAELLTRHKYSEAQIGEVLSKSTQLIENVKRGILNGTIVNLAPKSPSAKIKNIAWGTLDMSLVTGSVEIPTLPGTYLQGKVVAVDLTATSQRKLSVRKISYLTLSSSEAPKVNKQPIQEPMSDNYEEYYSQMGPSQDYGDLRANRKQRLTKLAEMVPRQSTTLSDLAFAEALRKGYTKVFGKEPSKEVLAFGWAQGVLESGRPVKLPNNNIGNIKVSSSWIKENKPFFIRDAHEFDKEGKSYIQKQAKWKSFATPEEGAVEYWKLLANRYGDALTWAEAGNHSSAVVSLGAKGYFTAPIKNYAKGVSGLYQEFMTKIAPQISQEAPKPHAIPNVEPKPEVDQLISTLFASEMPLTRLVQSKQTAQLTAYFIGHPIVSLEAARILGHWVRELDGMTKLGQNNTLEIILANSPALAQSVISALADHLVTQINNKYGIELNYIVTQGADDSPAMPLEQIYSNLNKFNLLILNGIKK